MDIPLINCSMGALGGQYKGKYLDNIDNIDTIIKAGRHAFV